MAPEMKGSHEPFRDTWAEEPVGWWRHWVRDLVPLSLGSLSRAILLGRRSEPDYQLAVGRTPVGRAGRKL